MDRVEKAREAEDGGEERGRAREEEDEEMKIEPPPPHYSQYHANLATKLPEQTEKDANKDTFRNIYKTRTTKISTANTKLETFEDFSKLWDELEDIKDIHNYFMNLIPCLLYFINHDPILKGTFDSKLAQQAALNPDLKPYLAYLQSHPSASFPISQVQNEFIYGNEFNFFRVSRVKNDVVNLILAAFQAPLYLYVVHGGFIFCPPQPALQKDFSSGYPIEKIYFNEFQVCASPKRPASTAADVTLAGQTRFYNQFLVRNDLSSNLLRDMGGAKKKFSENDFGGEPPKNRTLVIPIMRALCQPYGNASVSMIKTLAQEKCCSISPHSNTELYVEHDSSKSSKTPDLLPLRPLAGSARAYTYVSASFDYLKYSGQNLPAQDLTYQLNFELLDSEVQTDKEIMRVPPIQVKRVKHEASKHAFPIGWNMQTTVQRANPFLKSFFKHKGFLAVDPVAVISGVSMYDSFECKFTSYCSEGNPCYVSGFVMISALQGVSKRSFDEHVSALKSNTIATKNKAFLPLFKTILTSSDYTDLEIALS